MACLSAAVRKAAVALLALSVLFSTVLAVNPSLHHRLHLSGDHHSKGVPFAPEHQCAATLFAKGAVESTEVVPLLSCPLPVPAPLLPPAAGPCLPAIEYLLLPERAPPVA